MSTPNQPDKPRNGTAAGAPTSGSPRNQGPPPVRTAENQPGTPASATTPPRARRQPSRRLGSGEGSGSRRPTSARPDAEGRARAVGPDPERSVRTEAAMAKAAVIDGPTRSLAVPSCPRTFRTCPRPGIPPRRRAARSAGRHRGAARLPGG